MQGLTGGQGQVQREVQGQQEQMVLPEAVVLDLFLFQSLKKKNVQVTQAPYSQDLVPYNFWLFPKIKLPLKRKRFQTVDEIQENVTGQLMVIGTTL